MFCHAKEENDASEELQYGIENAPLLVVNSYTQDLVLMWENINRVPRGICQSRIFVITRKYLFNFLPLVPHHRRVLVDH